MDIIELSKDLFKAAVNVAPSDGLREKIEDLLDENYLKDLIRRLYSAKD